MGARSSNHRSDVADVTEVWSANLVQGGPPFDHHMSIVHVVLRDGSWVPDQLLN